jgi:hypothetical protein
VHAADMHPSPSPPLQLECEHQYQYYTSRRLRIPSRRTSSHHPTLHSSIIIVCLLWYYCGTLPTNFHALLHADAPCSGPAQPTRLSLYDTKYYTIQYNVPCWVLWVVHSPYEGPSIKRNGQLWRYEKKRRKGFSVQTTPCRNRLEGKYYSM